MLAVSISVACAVAGLVVGTIGQTGIGLQFTESVVALSGGQLWLALILVAVAALVLGMGLPATAAYIVLAVMTGPALQELGLALITAHMIIFWLAQSSNVTPPIALAAFAGAGVAGASPMRSAVEAVKLASGLFIIPLMMAYAPLTAQYRIWLGRRSAGGHGHRLVDVDAGHVAAAILVWTCNTDGARDRIYRSCIADLSVHRVTSIGHLLGDGSYVGQSSGTHLSRRLLVIAVCFSFGQPLFVRRVLTVVPESPVAGFAAGDNQRPHRLLFNKLHDVLMRR